MGWLVGIAEKIYEYLCRLIAFLSMYVATIEGSIVILIFLIGFFQFLTISQKSTTTSPPSTSENDIAIVVNQHAYDEKYNRIDNRI